MMHSTHFINRNVIRNSFIGGNYSCLKEGWKCFNDAFSKFYLWLYDKDMVKDHSTRQETHFHHYMGYSFLIRSKFFSCTIPQTGNISLPLLYQIAREETRCCHIGYSFWLAARVLLYASSHRQDNTYHSLCYLSREALAETRNSSMGPPWRIDPTTHRTISERSYHGATSSSKTGNWDLIS